MPQRYYGQDPWGWAEAGEGIAGLISAIRNRDKQEADYWMYQMQMDPSVLQNPRAVDKISKYYPWVVSPTTSQQFVQNRGQVPLTGAPIPGLGGDIQPMYGDRQPSLLDDTIKRLLGGTQGQTRLANGKKGLVNVQIPGRMPSEKEYAVGEKLLSERELTSRELSKEHQQTFRELEKQRIASRAAIQQNWQTQYPGADPNTVQLMTDALNYGRPMPRFTDVDLELAIEKNAANQQALEKIKGQMETDKARATEQEKGTQLRTTERERLKYYPGGIEPGEKYKADQARAAVEEAARIRAGATAAGKELTPSQRAQIEGARARYVALKMKEATKPENPLNQPDEFESLEKYQKWYKDEEQRAGGDFDAKLAGLPIPQAGAPYQDEAFDNLQQNLFQQNVPRGTQPALKPAPAHKPPVSVQPGTDDASLEAILARMQSMSKEELFNFLRSLPPNVIRKLFGK